MTTKPTPTEEHRRAAALVADVATPYRAATIAALLAEREAPLRERAEKAERERNANFMEARDTAGREGLARLDRDRAFARAVEAEQALAASRAEVARLTAERDEYTRYFGVDRSLVRAAFDEKHAALAASRAEVEALRAYLDKAESTLRAVVEETRLLLGSDDEAAWETVQNVKSLAGDYLPAPRTNARALSSTPAPASAEPATPTTAPDCPRESPLCITKGPHAADECDVDTAVLRTAAEIVGGEP